MAAHRELLRTLQHQSRTTEEIEKSRSKQIAELLKANEQLQEHVSETLAGLKQTGGSQGRTRRGRAVSNDWPIKPPANLTVLDNTLLFLPEKGVRELNLEPNMNDKGDEDRKWILGSQTG